MDEARLISEVLDRMFPDAHCELDHRNNFELLVAVMLSAQTTDKNVNNVTKTLFKLFPTAEALAVAKLEDIEDAIKTLGLYHNKARNLKKTAETLVKEYRGVVPDTREELMKLPGVGRKTANVVLAVAFNKPAFAVDTHVERVSKRLCIAEENDSVLEVERKLTAFFPKADWPKLHHQMIFFGRYHCFARKPDCARCELQALCRFYQDNMSGNNDNVKG